MKRIFAFILMTGAAGLLAACDDEATRAHDITGVDRPVAGPLRAEIAGPVLIQKHGQYSWHARVDGNAEEAEYFWEVYGLTIGDNIPTFEGPSIDLFVGAEEPSSFTLQLRVRSGSATAFSQTLVTVCPASADPVDDCSSIVLMKEDH
jgi:hypothetical protein